MRIDLTNVEIFESNELVFDKKITFIYGKNGTGKSTITNEIKKQLIDKDVSIYYAGLIDENKRLNAVVLGEENAEINRQIESKLEEIHVKESEIESINKTLQKPDADEESNYWTRRELAKNSYNELNKSIENFLSLSAAKIKNIDKPRVAHTSYDKRNFRDDIMGACLLSEEEKKRLIDTIKSEIKESPVIIFPNVNIDELCLATNDILEKTVAEKIKIARLESNSEKREFAKAGLRIHQKGEICAFCGNKIEDHVIEELDSYFSADEVKAFQEEILNKKRQMESIVEGLDNLHIDTSNFYPMCLDESKEISQELETVKARLMKSLNILIEALDEKLKYLFEKRPHIFDLDSVNLDDVENKYNNLRIRNNENDLANKQAEATEKLRKHHVRECLDEFGYEAKITELSMLREAMTQRILEYDAEEKKIVGVGGLNSAIQAIQYEITELRKNTVNETLLAININQKLKHMVNFELIHVEEEETNGFYRIRDLNTGYEREVTELSTGEKNIIAFLYFIEKLNEVKEAPDIKPRVIVFDDPMCSNDDGMQYLIIEELQRLMKKLLDTDKFILLTHNKHFYLNVIYDHPYNKDRYIRLQSDGKKTHFIIISRAEDDYKTSYESLWSELKFLYGNSSASADLLLNPIRRIIETYTKFNGVNKKDFCAPVDGAMKLFNVNSHSIDDVEAELNGKTKNEIIQLFCDCFFVNGEKEHFKTYWKDLEIDDDGRICFEDA